MNNTVRTLTRAALVAAIICVCTMIHVPVPGLTSAYIHPGDAFILLAGCWLSPLWALAAAGIGSMLSDLILGYAVYAIPTFIIKAGMGALAAVLAARAGKASGIMWLTLPPVIMLVGYFAFEAVAFSTAAALAALPFNLIQAVGGSLIALILRPILRKALPDMK